MGLSGRGSRNLQGIHEKANRVLQVLLLIFIVFSFRIWQLSVLQHDFWLERARHPQRRTIIEKSARGTICDRFGVSLAINKTQYDFAINYEEIRELPRVAWWKDDKGDLIKHFVRRDYITSFSDLISTEVGLGASRVEDLIHGKAALYQRTPFVVERNIPEAMYYRLGALRRDWPGIYVSTSPRRFYPLGKIAGSLLGYMGAINREEYSAVIEEMSALTQFLETGDLVNGLNIEDYPTVSAIRKRLQELKEKSYGINDSLGKSGLESVYEEALRGYRGIKIYQSDARDKFLRRLPGSRESVPGEQVQLALSSELQEFCEALLADNESYRDERNIFYDKKSGIYRHFQTPWIKGGAIVAMDPNTGEIYALASYPRVDPNDFVPIGFNEKLEEIRQENLLRYLESPQHIQKVWDQQSYLKKELYDKAGKKFIDKKELLTWKQFLSLTLPSDNQVRKFLEKADVSTAVIATRAVNKLKDSLELSSVKDLLELLYPKEGVRESAEQIGQRIEVSLDAQKWLNVLHRKLSIFSNVYDKLLALDSMRLVIREETVGTELLEYIGNCSLSDFKETSAAYLSIKYKLKKLCRKIFNQNNFASWRKEEQQKFLQEKRTWETEHKHYHRPWVDLLDKEELRQFSLFWEEFGVALTGFFISQNSGYPCFDDPDLFVYLEAIRQFSKKIVLDKELDKKVEAFRKQFAFSSPVLIDQLLKNFLNYSDLTEDLWGRYRGLRKTHGRQTLQSLASAFYPLYGLGYGRSHAYRQATQQGSIFKLVTAYQALLERYKELQGSDFRLEELNPLTIVDKVERKRGKTGPWIVGYRMSGKPIYQFHQEGRIPRTLDYNLGTTDLKTALIRSSNTYFALLAGEVIADSSDLLNAAKAFSYGSRTGIELTGEYPGRLPTDLDEDQSGLYAFSIGQHAFVSTPLQSAVMLSTIANGGHVLRPRLVRSVSQQERNPDWKEVFHSADYSFRDSLAVVGIDSPIFTETARLFQSKLLYQTSIEELRSVQMPDPVRTFLLDTMHETLRKSYTKNLWVLKKRFHARPEAIEALINVGHQIAGKTSTSEVMEVVGLDRKRSLHMYRHIWFGGISFLPPKFGQDKYSNPDLVVVVYLRFGGYGQEAAPIAAQVVEKWRQIVQQHS